MELPKYFYFRVRVINKGTGVEVEDASDVDVVEVVRCKDCKYSRPHKSGIKLHCAWWYRSVYDDDFCSKGERSEE